MKKLFPLRQKDGAIRILESDAILQCCHAYEIQPYIFTN